MSTFERIITYIRKTILDYDWNPNLRHFDLYEGSDIDTCLIWNESFEVPKPTQVELNAITNDELAENAKKIRCKSQVLVVPDSKYILGAELGSIALIAGVLKIYTGEVWVEI